MKQVKFPVFIGSIKVIIQSDVHNQILLLLSGASMKRAKLVWNFLTGTSVAKTSLTKLGSYYLLQQRPLLYSIYTYLLNDDNKIFFVFHTPAVRDLSITKKKIEDLS